jgi:cyclophilin family peptidyl-prolyl cis-trans isomerase/HEAT repeat protein
LVKRRDTLAVLSASALLASCLLGCPRDQPAAIDAAESASPLAALSAQPAAEPDRVSALLHAEDTRRVRDVTDEDLDAANPAVRRAAARALARGENLATRERLLRTLHDLDPEVVAWSAYGLGQICATDREHTTRALVARAVSLHVEPPTTPGRLDPWFALARAIGRCATPEAERTLVAWLAGPKDRAVAASYGLGNVATHHRRMEEETAAALLRAAAGDAANDAIFDAFYPFGRLTRAPARVTTHLLESCRARMGHAAPSRVFAIRALATLEDEAIKDLEEVLRAETGYSPAERAEAARALGKVSSPEARKALLRAVDELRPPSDPAGLTGLVGPGFGPLFATLQAIRPEGAKALRSKTLSELAVLPVPPGAPAAVQRRTVLLRCEAARISVGSSHNDPSLVGCDPDVNGAVGAIARLAVLDRDKLEGSRHRAWELSLDPAKQPRVREAALEMIGRHDELKDAVAVVAKALSAKELGVVATAATVVASHPERFMVAPKGKPGDAKRDASEETATQPDPALAKALEAAFRRDYPRDAIETRGALARASGALRLPAARPWLQGLCASPNPTLREHAAAALSSLDGKKTTCAPRDGAFDEPAPELGHLRSKTTRLVLETDVGTLTIELDPSLAPVTATRVSDLVARKFYDGIVVHRVVPGFVAQFGDPDGDGFGGAGAAPLRCETSPVSFEAGVVGVALAGRDTGSSQLFVTLAPSPHLDGEYAVIGRATGPWDALVEGDVLRSVRLAE